MGCQGQYTSLHHPLCSDCANREGGRIEGREREREREGERIEGKREREGGKIEGKRVRDRERGERGLTYCT